MPRRAQIRLIALALLLFAAFELVNARIAEAAASAWLDHEQARLRLLAASDTAGEDGTLRLGLHVELQPGWKIYWRSPGDAGFPPSLDWSQSENLASTQLRWPAPHRFTLFGLQTFGYADEVVLPIDATLERPGEAATLRAEIRYLICEEICIPYDGKLSLDLPAGPQTPSRDAFLIEQYRSQVPGDGSRVGLELVQANLVARAAEPELQLVARSTIPFDAPDVLVEGPPGFLFGVPTVQLDDDKTEARFRVATSRNSLAEGELEGKQLTLTVIDGKRGLESVLTGQLGEALFADLAPAIAPQSLLVILGLAVIGGLILNLMPCVLPVLSIKLLSVVGQGGRDRRDVRLGFLASAAGILFSFLVLAGAAIALKATGMSVGWGVQFQQPLFLAAMAVIVTLFACNLFGLFEITLPGWLGAAAVAGSGGHHGSHSLPGHFLTGAFATLLATPCSAPFLGTAVGFALAGAAGDILLVFVALGIGLALPYLLVAAAPGLASRLPKPGHWMITLRRILGLALVATAVWLLSVLAVQVGIATAIAMAVILVAAGVFLALGRVAGRRLFAGLAGLAAAAVVAIPAFFGAPASTGAATDDWLPLDEARIASLVAEGRVVFVDVTADWCITCQVNKQVVIDQGRVAEALSNGEVTPMRGDWTLPDPAISDYLASFGRYGIPFNAVYGPGLPHGEVLPEILTTDRVMDALERAAGP